ncbi:MAG: zinc ribbon domain-containing protein [Clostridia bacterium]|nr:zinc ribbon domain-containing protein [Clostridia bacterium]
MAKFCGNCGAPANDNDRLCGNCGAPLPNVPAAPAAAPTAANTYAPGGSMSAPAHGLQSYGVQAPGTPTEPIQGSMPAYGPQGGYGYDPLATGPMTVPPVQKKTLNGKTIGIIAAAVVVVIAVVVTLVLTLGGKNKNGASTYEGAVKQLCQALSDNDAKKLYQVVLSKSGYDEDDVADRYELGDYKKVTYDIKSKEALDKETINKLKELLNEAGYKDADKITEGYFLEGTWTETYKSGGGDNGNLELLVFKIGKSWKVLRAEDLYSVVW